MTQFSSPCGAAGTSGSGVRWATSCSTAWARRAKASAARRSAVRNAAWARRKPRCWVAVAGFGEDLLGLLQGHHHRVPALRLPAGARHEAPGAHPQLGQQRRPVLLALDPLEDKTGEGREVLGLRVRQGGEGGLAPLQQEAAQGERAEARLVVDAAQPARGVGGEHLGERRLGRGALGGEAVRRLLAGGREARPHVRARALRGLALGGLGEEAEGRAGFRRGGRRRGSRERDRGRPAAREAGGPGGAAPPSGGDAGRPSTFRPRPPARARRSSGTSAPGSRELARRSPAARPGAGRPPAPSGGGRHP